MYSTRTSHDSRFFRLDLHGCGFVRKRSDKATSAESQSQLIHRSLLSASIDRRFRMKRSSPITILSDCHWDLCLDYSINSTDFVGYFPSTFKQEGLVDGADHCGKATGES